MTDIRAQEHKFRAFIGQAVSPHLSSISNLKTGAVVSTEEEDTTLSFDMRVGVYAEVSVRLRRNQYHSYRDFSIRSKTRFSGKVIDGETVKCEIDKIRGGLGGCYFYGWLDNAQSQIIDYVIVDIERLRGYIDDERYYSERKNPDGWTAARYYQVPFLDACGALIFDAQGRCAA
jgi:hypothetical protein